MAKVRLGRTEIVVEKNGFGALPIQRVNMDTAKHILRKAYENGIEFFDTARFYTDSEEKLGEALSDVRNEVVLASKTGALNAEDFWKDLETTLNNLKTDHLDIYQFHNPPFCPLPGGEDGLYDAMLKAKEEGKVRFIGITNHRLAVAHEAIDSGMYDTLQFPFCYLSAEKETELVEKCRKADMGFIAMKALSGGLITSSEAAAAFMMEYDNVLPIWGIQREKELDEFLEFVAKPPVMTEEISALIEKDRKELQGEFCRGCGYCMPCPAGIEINNCARMSLLLRRSPSEQQLTPEVQAKMKKIEECLHCGKCKTKCPYGLDTPALLEKNYKDYKEVLAGKAI
ncbi:aldo/keto reductase [Murimonas intestini]|uniref:aldo/keto reductase n=1 Tax=Murimonas intestini TaxID=1337051 RepID=UPI0011DCADE7|nr:aldo/keto reductase [Murimonas intestini]